MKITAIFGSPNPGGFSSRVHELFLSPCEEAGISVTRIHVYGSSILPCTDCGVCRHESRCIHDDDMNQIYEHIREDDALTISSPVYFSSLPGPLKNLVDRCQLFWEARKRDQVLCKKRPAYFLATAGSQYPHVFTSTVTVIRHLYNTLDCVFSERDFFLLAGVDTIDTLPDDSRERLQAAGREFARRILGNF